MDNVVPPQITAELTQILSNLVLGDNEIRSNAEKAVNERLAHTPELYLLALAQFAIGADTDVMRSFSLVLLRRLLFRPAANQERSPTTPASPRLTLFDILSANGLATIERLLLHSLVYEPSQAVRRKAIDTTCDLANSSMSRGRPWHALQSQAFTLIQGEDQGLRDVAYRVFAGSPNLIMDLQMEAVLDVLRKGLTDPSFEVRLAALKASVSYIYAADQNQIPQCASLILPILGTLPIAPPAQLALLLSTITPLATVHPLLFEPQLSALLSYLPPLILPPPDSGPTPTVDKPFPSLPESGVIFSLPPPDASNASSGQEQEVQRRRDRAAEAAAEARSDTRKAALELMLSLSEASPLMVRKVDGWTAAIIRGCLEGLGELQDDPLTLEMWLDADPSDDPTEDNYPHVYEESLDRIACALGGKSVLSPAFQYIPTMLANYDWRIRHAGLLAISAIGEGTSKYMQNELGKVIDLVTPMFSDTHPRVRYAACQCVGQLCTDLEEVMQEKYHDKLFAVLIPALEAPESRVHAHAAAALINFCEGVARDTLIPYLDPIVARLLALLNPRGGIGVRRYVQEQAIATLAMVADASEATFAKHYSSVMPLLLDILRNAEGPDYRKLRVKAMECAGLIAIAVGRDIFRGDSNTLVELLMRIQNTPLDPGDTLLGHYLISTWAKICQAMGPEFEPYLPVVMPPLLEAAAIKADISICDEDDEAGPEREGWENIAMDGQTVSVRTSAIEEKCQAFETLVIYSSTLGPKFAPYLARCLELALPSLKFHFHDGVREACALLIPILFACGQKSSTLTSQMVSATFLQLINCLTHEHDVSFLASLFKCSTDATLVLGGPSALPQEISAGLIDATKRQLEILGERRRQRAARPVSALGDEKEEMALLEEMEDFALEDIAKMLMMFDTSHPLLIAVSGVRDLGFNLWDLEDEV